MTKQKRRHAKKTVLLASPNEQLQSDAQAITGVNNIYKKYRQINIVDKHKLLAINTQWQNNLKQQYYEALVRKQTIPKYYKNKNVNIIDLTPIAKHGMKIAESTPWCSFINEHGYMAFLPCFPQGILLLNNQYKIHWHFLRMNIEQRFIEIRLFEYYNEIIPHHIVDASIQLPETPDEEPLILLSEKCHGYKSLRHSINIVKECQWNTKDRNVWNHLIHDEYQIIQETNSQLNGVFTDEQQYKAIVNDFLTSISYVNSILYSQKSEKHQHTKTITDDTAITMGIKSYTPKIIKHVYSNIEIISNYIPLEPKEKTLVNYSVPSWSRRGFIRNLSNGKTTYVRPTICKRQGINDTDEKHNVQTIIKIIQGGNTNE